MLLIHLLEAALLTTATAASPFPDQEAINDNRRQSPRACVYGTPKQYDQWTIRYHEVKPPTHFPGRFVLDPAWSARHQTVGDADVGIPSYSAKGRGSLRGPALLIGKYLGALGGE
ncbi:hypothetical protein TgHK011_000232 [Trichoderma gracile]|nr:hypothetical protein TgHK011_000232 [Trichoderma gracile]